MAQISLVDRIEACVFTSIIIMINSTAQAKVIASAPVASSYASRLGATWRAASGLRVQI
jgi:hypothetical protein